MPLSQRFISSYFALCPLISNSSQLQLYLKLDSQLQVWKFKLDTFSHKIFIIHFNIQIITDLYQNKPYEI